MAQFETWLRSDLSKMINVVNLNGVMFSADNGGNKIGVIVTDKGQSVTLTGGVVAYIIREDGQTVIQNGSISGNRAYVVLPASAYTVIGRISIVIKLDNTTIGACTGHVYRTTTDAIVDPGHVIPNLQELLAQIAACQQATTDANNAASAANTAAGSANSAASAANTAAGSANSAAGVANGAAGAANTAAGKIDNMTVAAEAASGSTPDAVISEVNGHKHIQFKLVKGDKGDNGAWVFIRYSAVQPTQDSDMKTTPDAWMGIYSGESETAPTTYASYTWYNIKGATGSPGPGVPSGGTAGQFLKKSSGTDYDDEWTTVRGSDLPVSASDTRKIDVALENEEAALAIVINGDTVPNGVTLSKGQYLFIKNHSTLPTGGYHVTAATITSGTTISSSNVEVDSKGIANAINDRIVQQGIKSATVSATTSAGGNVTNVLSGTGHILISAKSNGTDNYMIIPWYYAEGGTWSLHVFDNTDLSPVRNTSMSITYYYYDI